MASWRASGANSSDVRRYCIAKPAIWANGPRWISAVSGATGLVRGAKRMAVVTGHVSKRRRAESAGLLHLALGRGWLHDKRPTPAVP